MQVAAAIITSDLLPCPAPHCPKARHSRGLTFEPTPNKDRLKTGRQNTVCHCPTDTWGRFGLGAEQARVQAGPQGLQGSHPSPAEPLCPPAPLEPRVVPEAGPQGIAAIRGRAPAQLLLNGAAVELFPAVAGAAAWPGAGPGAGDSPSCTRLPLSRGNHPARPLRQPAAEPGGAQQTPPGAAGCPRAAGQHSPPQRPCPVTAWLRASVSPGQSEPGGLLEDKGFLHLQRRFTPPFTGQPKLTGSDSSHMGTDPGL